MGHAFNVVLAVTALAPGLGCSESCSRGVGLDFNAEAEHLQRLTISAGAQGLDRRSVVRSTTSRRQDWRVATKIPWASYVKQLTDSIETAYRCEARSETGMACVRQLPGDLLHLELVAEPASTGLHARISLEMHPD